MSIGNQKNNVVAMVAKRYINTTHMAISTTSTSTETKKLYLDCFDIKSSQRIFKKVSNKYSNMIMIPLTPLALSSGNNTEKIVANTMIDINHDFHMS